MSEKNTKLAKIEAFTPSELLKLAVTNNLDLDKLERLLAMQERWEKNEARKLFYEAKAEFQQIVPEIKKNRSTKFEARREGGAPTQYNWADLAHIQSQIKDALKKTGLSYHWEDVNDNPHLIRVKTVLTHVAGHSEFTINEAERDVSGSKNKIQERMSSTTYLQRYGLKGILGLSTTEDDVDGALSVSAEEYVKEKISKCKMRPQINKIWIANENLQKEDWFKNAIETQIKKARR